MKNSKLVCVAFLLFGLVGFAQSNCSAYYPFSEGAKTEITTYDKKGKVAAVVNSEVMSVVSKEGAEVATLKSTVKDDKGEMIAESEYDIRCANGSISVDFKSMLGAQQLEQFKNMDYEITGTNVEFPNDLSVGQTLPDANMHMKINMSGINMNMNFAITDRKVTGKESVTSPAGTFDCFVIEYNTDMKMGMNQSGSSKQWIAEGVGMVKQEDYNKKGKVMSSSMLTAFNN